MTSASTTILIPTSAKKVWEVLADFKHVSHFHPLVKESPIISSTERGIGAIRRCEFHDGTCAVEKIIGWEEGHSLTIDISEGSMPLIKLLKHGTVTLTINPKDTVHCHVTAHMEFSLKGGVMGNFLARILVAPMTRRMFHHVLCGLQHFIQTGEFIESKVPKQIMMHCQFVELPVTS